MFSRIFLLSLIPSIASAEIFPKKTTRGALVEANEVTLVPTPVEAVHEDIFNRNLVDKWCSSGYADSCVLGTLFDNDVELYKSCGALFKENDEWCYDPIYGEICCGEDLTDCCDPKPGAITGLALVVLLVIIGCCCCCKHCCCQKNETPVVVRTTTTTPKVTNNATTVVHLPPVYASSTPGTREVPVQEPPPAYAPRTADAKVVPEGSAVPAAAMAY